MHLKLKAIIVSELTARSGGKHMKTLRRIALTLVIIGAINWGLIGFFKFDLVATIFGQDSFVSRLIFSLVGLSGLVCITYFFNEWDDGYDNEGQLNLATEFGEEEDFSDLDDYSHLDDYR